MVKATTGRGELRTHDDPREDALFSSIERGASVVQRLETASSAADDEVQACLAVLAVRGQALRFLRALAGWSQWRGNQRAEAAIGAHRASLERSVQEATSRLHSFDRHTCRLAEARLGLRLAVVGKGGAGKTTISATLARLLARRGRMVVAADLDTCPGLAYSLGIPDVEAGLPVEALEAHEGVTYGWRLSGAVSPQEVVERHATPGPDGVAYLGVSKIDASGAMGQPPSGVAVLEVLLGLGEPGWDVVGDFEAGTTTPFERQHLFADRVLVVVGPSRGSVLAARRLVPLLGEVPFTVVANRLGDGDDPPGFVPSARIPFDPAVGEADRLGLSPLDHCPGSPAMAAIARLADQLVSPMSEELPS